MKIVKERKHFIMALIVIKNYAKAYNWISQIKDLNFNNIHLTQIKRIYFNEYESDIYKKDFRRYNKKTNMLERIDTEIYLKDISGLELPLMVDVTNVNKDNYILAIKIGCLNLKDWHKELYNGLDNKEMFEDGDMNRLYVYTTGKDDDNEISTSDRI